jgi:hypothetical protein
MLEKARKTSNGLAGVVLRARGSVLGAAIRVVLCVVLRGG